MQPALSQVCSLESPFELDVADYAAGQCRAIEVWLTKLETYLKSHTHEQLRQLLDEHGVQLPVASFQGGLLSSQGEARREAWQLFERRLQLCRQSQIGVLVVACDVAAPLNPTDIERVQVSLQQVAQLAAQYDVRAALEFQARAAVGNNLQTAAALVQDVGSVHLGLCLDAFQLHVGPSKYEDLGYLSAENLFHVQLSDVADRPRELAADSDRILPGEGEIRCDVIVQRLREIGYTGHVSIEVMNPMIWRIPPRQFGEIGMTAIRRLLGQAG
jgi:2-keto-myo-inositol isomerase